MPEHTLAALAGPLAFKFNSKRSLKKIQNSRWNLKHRRTKVSAASHLPFEPANKALALSSHALSHLPSLSSRIFTKQNIYFTFPELQG